MANSSIQVPPLPKPSTFQNLANSVTDLKVAYRWFDAVNRVVDNVSNLSFTANATGAGAYDQANAAYLQANVARDQANTAYDQANSAFTQANGAFDQANAAYGQANAAYGQANVAYDTANAAANTVAVFANGTLVLVDANLNFNNTSTVNVSATANGTTQANVAFTANLKLPYDQANAAYAQANIAFLVANTVSNYLNTEALLLGEPSGFQNQTDSVISLNVASRVFTINANTPNIATYNVYINGNLFALTSNTFTLSNTTNNWVIYYTDGGTLTGQALGANSSPIDYTPYLKGNALVAHIYYDANAANDVIFGDQRHGPVMDWATIRYIETTLGSGYVSGLAIQNYVIGGSTSSNASAQVGFTNGVINNADLVFNIIDGSPQTISSAARIPVMYMSGAEGTWKKTIATTYPVYQGATLIAYNLNTANTWTTPDVSTSNYVAMWVCATNDVHEPLVAILGQNQYTKLTTAQASETWAAVNLNGMPYAIFRPLYRLIFQTATGYTNAPKAILVDALDVRALAIGIISTQAGVGNGKITIQNNATVVNGTSVLNFANGANIQMVVTDDSANGKVNVWIDSTGGGGGGGASLNVAQNSGTITTNTSLITFNNTATINATVTANGTGKANITFDANTTALSTFITSDFFSATANQTVFTLSSNVSAARYCFVARNGVEQVPAADYTVANNVLTLTSNCVAGESVEVRNFVVTGNLQLNAGTTRVQNTNVALGTQASYQADFTYYTIPNVMARGQFNLLQISASAAGLYDLVVRGNSNNNGTLFLQATDIFSTLYTMSFLFYYASDDTTTNLYIGIRNRGGVNQTYNISSYSGERFA